MKKMYFCFLIGLLLLGVLFFGHSNVVNADCPEAIASFETIEEAAIFLREGIVARSFERNTDSSVIAVVAIAKTAVAEYDNNVDSIVHSQILPIIYAHTGNPQGGDYLERNSGLGSWASDFAGDYWYISIEWHYEFTHEQAEELDAAVEQLLLELDVYHKNDYEKVRAIYDWMCLNITYDHTLNNYSAYDAMCKKSVVCQGYGSLFYRLCLELGVDCRYCGGLALDMWGQANGHGWNVVKIDGEYYYVDTTWGAGLINGQEVDYYYFLKGMTGLDDHIIVPSRWENEIGDYCVVAEKDYPVPEKEIILYSDNYSDTITWYVTRSGEMVISGSGEMDYTPDYWNFSEYVHEITISEGITFIGMDMFSGFGLASVTLPDSLVYIAEGAFVGLTTQVDLPKHIETIEPGAFSARMNAISLDNENPYYTVENNCLFTKNKKTLVLYAGVVDVEHDSIIREYHIPEGVETIGAHAFENQDILCEIVLPNSVKYIGDSAFFQCTYATIQLTDSVVSVGDRALLECFSICSLYIGKNLEHFGNEAFYSARLESIKVHSDNQFFICVDNVLFTKDMSKLILYPVASKNSSYVIPEGVTCIQAYAFAGFESSLIQGANLETVIFPQSVVSIGDSAFNGQIKIKELNLPYSLETIGHHAFTNVSLVDTIVIPDSVTNIGEWAFYGNGAETIYIGKGLEILGIKAFLRHDHGTAEIQVHINGLPPTVIGSDYNPMVFGYDYMPCEFVSIYYPYEYRYMWAPNGEGTWGPDPEQAWNRFQIVTYMTVDDCCYEVMATDPQCTEQGYVTYTCIYCGDCYIEYTDAAGHYFSEWYIDRFPCCNQTGWGYRECKKCGYYENEIPTTEHCYDTVVTEPTYTQQGYTTHICTVCGDSYVDSYTDPLPYIPGDADGEGTVNTDDAIYLLYNVMFGDEDYPVNQNCDFDGNGSVNTDDAIYLLYYVMFGEEDYPLH